MKLSPCVGTSTSALDCTANLSGNKPWASAVKRGRQNIVLPTSPVPKQVITGVLFQRRQENCQGPEQILAEDRPWSLSPHVTWGRWLQTSPKDRHKGRLGWRKPHLIWKSTDRPRAQFQAFRECSLHNKHVFPRIKIKMHKKHQTLQNP